MKQKLESIFEEEFIVSNDNNKDKKDKALKELTVP